MRIQVLGEIEAVSGDDERVNIGGPRQRRLLAALVARWPEPASTGWLEEAVWADPTDRPKHPTDTIRTYVARLRRALGEEAILTGDNSYELRIEGDGLDACRFERLLADGRRSTSTAAERAAALDDALSLWRGPAYGSLGQHPPFEVEHHRLEELRLSAREARLETGLELGDHRALIGEIESLTRQVPLREAPQRLLLVAMYRSGAQAEALRAFQTYRSRLVEELGLEPSPELLALEQQIARRDKSLDQGEPSRHLAGFELCEPIGKGDYGTVFRAIQPALGREVAIKVMQRDYSDQPSFIRQFEVETQLIARLDHPNIVPLYDYWRDPAGAYLVMRYLPGGTLAGRIAESAQSPSEVVKWLEQIGGALIATHQSGFSHRDVSADNIVFDSEDNAYLVGFRLATLDALQGGAPAPEKDRPAADLRALGYVVLEALAGEPLTAESESGVDHRSLLTRIRPGLSTDLADAVSEAISGDVEGRETLGRLLSALGASANGGNADGGSQSRLSEIGLPNLTANPYRGLRAFEEADADVFFGRRNDIDSIVSELDHSGFVTVVGPSGSGKSSIVRAGVIPAIRHTHDWFVVMCTPGQDPFVEIEAALLRVAVNPPPSMLPQLLDGPSGLGRAIRRSLPGPDDEAVVVIDQFEEMYTLVDDPARRDLFLDALVYSASNPRSQVRFVVTLRADFYDKPLRHSGFGPLLLEHQHVVLPLTPAGLERAIAGPAEVAGAEVESGLVAELVRATDESNSSLPTLQYALTELFERTRGGPLTLESYQEMGGLTGAIAHRAEQLFQGLSPQAQSIAPMVFCELTTLGEGVEDTRRRIVTTDLVTSDEVDEILESFGKARLLSFDSDPTTRQPTVEVAHEALIREWPRFRSWIDAERSNLRIGRDVLTAARQWDAGGRDSSDLYRGGRLSTALDLYESKWVHWPDVAAEFLEVGAVEEQRRVASEASAHRRLRRLIVSVAAIAGLALVASAVAIVSQRNASDAARLATDARFEAETRRLSADAATLAASNRRVAFLLAAEAYRRDPGTTSLGALQSVFIGTPGFEAYIGAGADYEDVEWLNDRELLAVDARGVAIVDAGSGEALDALDWPAISAVAISSDQKQIAIGSGFEVQILDTGLNVLAGPFVGPSRVESVAFGPNGELAVGHREGQLVLWGIDSGARELEILAHPEQSMGAYTNDEILSRVPHQPESFLLGVRHLSFTPDGRQLLSGSLALVRVWDTATADMIDEFVATRTILDGSVAVTNLTDVRAVGDDVVLTSTAFSLKASTFDGTTIDELTFPGVAGTVPASRISTAVDLGDQSAVVATAGGGVAEMEWVGLNLKQADVKLSDAQLAGDPSISRSPDGERIAFAAQDGIAIMNISGGNAISRVVSIDVASEVSISMDGRWLVSSSPDQVSAQIFDLSGRRYRRVSFTEEVEPDFAWAGFRDGLLAWRFAPDVGLYSLTSDFEVSHDYPAVETVSQLAASQDGQLLAVGGAPRDNSGLVVWVLDNQTGELVAELGALGDMAGEGGEIRSLGFSENNEYLVGAAGNGAAVIWDTSTWETLSPPLSAGGGSVVQAKYSPGDDWLVTVALDGEISLRDPDTLQPVHRLTGNTDGVEGFSYGPAFTRDGHYMLTTSDGQGRLWDLDAKIQLGSTFPSDRGTAPNGSGNARWLVTISDGDAVIWDLDLGSWFGHACRSAGRNLTRDEWDQFGPADQAYTSTCPQWPADEARESEQQI